LHVIVADVVTQPDAGAVIVLIELTGGAVLTVIVIEAQDELLQVPSARTK
jgi:hypothetical protein